jgi:hypothetical protein
MIRFHFTIKRKVSPDKDILGRITSIGFHFIEQPESKKGIIRLTSLKNDKFGRLKNGQLVMTEDGFGVIKGYKEIKDDTGKISFRTGVNVKLRNLSKDKIFYNLNNIKVVDIIDNKTGDKFPAIESDYPYLLLDEAPVDFLVNKANKAILSLDSRRKLSVVKIFTKKTNGIKLFNLLIQKGIWTPIKK